MATANVLIASNAPTAMSMHPFLKREDDRQFLSHDSDDVPSDDTSPSNEEGAFDGAQDSKRRPARRRAAQKGLIAGQRTLQDVFRVGPSSQHANLVEGTCDQGFAANDERRKRRKTSNEDTARHTLELGFGDTFVECTTPKATVLEEKSDAAPLAEAIENPATRASHQHAPRNESGNYVVPPKKFLALNTNGTLISPPSRHPKKPSELNPASPPRKRGRPRKSTEEAVHKTLIAKIPYGKDQHHRSEIAKQVEQILGSRTPLPNDPISTKSQPVSSNKPTHPFFTGRAKQPQPEREPPNPPESPRKVAAATPGKLRSHAVSEKASTHQVADIVFTSDLLRDRHVVKYSGAQDAPFPTKYQAHVRGLDTPGLQLRRPATPWQRRNHKKVDMPLPLNESILISSFERSDSEFDSRMRSDGFMDPHPSLKLPRQLRLAGEQIVKRITPLLSSSCAQIGERKSLGFHHALSTSLQNLPSNFTAYDESRSENQGWISKSAPIASLDLLQPQNKIVVMRSWLNSLTVQAVGGSGTSISKGSAKSEKPQRPKKKYSDQLSDFLVDSSDEEYQMNDLEESEDELHRDHRGPKSTVRALNDKAKAGNAIVLSGPPGCGKTAAAYAVAKELGYRVFEINSSERRNGRDIIDRIGDMTENHLVKHHEIDTASTMSDVEITRLNDAFQHDLNSGKQGRMNAFFKPKAQKKPTSASKQEAKVNNLGKTGKQESSHKPNKDQQQSLILLEEVDVLFKEDKDFWSTILKLIETSKRPIIMTCNDESMVPLQAIPLHAVLRFTTTPMQLAADYLLLLAANQGHLLEREAVEALYQSKRFDLRATIMELNYWCQMGVGDPRGGLGWIFQRWPPGSDFDDRGRKLRNISEGTYQRNMGFAPNYELDMESSMEWAWENFEVSPYDSLGWGSEKLHARSLEKPMENSQRRIELLEKSLRTADALSSADNICHFDVHYRAPLDPSQPNITEKTRGQYIDGMTLLQADELVDYTCLSHKISTALVLSVFKIAGSLESRNAFDTKLATAITKKENGRKITRHDFACFDPIASISSTQASGTSPTSLTRSAFDGTFQTIIQDLAPYVRSIVRSDFAIEDQRTRLNDLLSNSNTTTNDNKPQRSRTTRAARSALQGSQRSSTRRDRWFTRDLDLRAVLATGGEDWLIDIEEPHDCRHDDVLMTDAASPSVTTDDAPMSSFAR